MAEVFVATKLAEAVLATAVERITDLLIQEAASFSSAREDVESLRIELVRIKCFLEDAEHKQEQDKRVRNWVAEVRDVSLEIENVIETYVYNVHFSYIKAFHLRKLRRQMDSIKDKLRSIREARQTYQIEFRGEGTSSLRNLRRSHPDDEEDDVIMLEATFAALKAQLMTQEDRRSIVSIVGMGGLGKTTLAKKMYNDVDVKKHFDCYAWVFISQQWVSREVLTEILMQVGFQSDQVERNFGKESYKFLEERKRKREFLKGLEDRELVNSIKNELKKKRYVVVLDDIWSIDAWHSIQSAFPKGKPGSKVVFTTRIETVASSADPHSSPIRLPLLTLAESWELLKHKAFPRNTFCERVCPMEFEELGKEMAEQCGGLPLAIVVLGGLLRTKNNSADEWKKVGKDLKPRMINKLKSEQQYRVEDILDLSFQDLPYYLKQCFLYLVSFPEDSEIRKRRLIRLWIAEGFIPAMENEDAGRTSMEDVGEQYLGELVDRCMVQVGKWDHTGKGVKTCHLHDLMRDFCILKAKEEFFLEIVQPDAINQFTAISSSRRIAIHVNHDLDRHTASVEQVYPHLRSLLCFSPTLSLRKKKFRMLRVMELDFLRGQDTYKLPNGTGNLIYLKYLRVTGVKCRLKLPQSLGKLRYLQTLDLRGNGHVLLPSSMSRLRHLLLPYSYSFPVWTVRSIFENDALGKIETLNCIYAKDLIRHNGVPPLCNIRDLGIRHFRSDKEVTLVLNSLASHSQLDRLRCLMMELRKGEFPDLRLLSQCHDLSRLHLVGVLSQENLLFLPKCIAKLDLENCPITKEKIAILEKLPNLRMLRLAYEYSSLGESGYKLVFSADGFAKLEVLTLHALFRLEEWEVEKGAMPNLKILNIKHLPELRMIPNGLKYLTTLRELNVFRMSREFMNRLRVKEHRTGKDFYKVAAFQNLKEVRYRPYSSTGDYSFGRDTCGFGGRKFEDELDGEDFDMVNCVPSISISNMYKRI